MKDLQKYKADFDNQNIILIGPSGVGKTEWQRALSQKTIRFSKEFLRNFPYRNVRRNNFFSLFNKIIYSYGTKYLQRKKQI